MLIFVLVLHHQQTSINNWPTAGRRSSEGHFFFRENLRPNVAERLLNIPQKRQHTRPTPLPSPIYNLPRETNWISYRPLSTNCSSPASLPIDDIQLLLLPMDVASSNDLMGSHLNYIYSIAGWLPHITEKALEWKTLSMALVVFQCSDLQRAGSSPLVSILVRSLIQQIRGSQKNPLHCNWRAREQSM